MRIIKTIIYSVSLFIFANTNAQDKPKEDLSILGKELFDLINTNGDDKIVTSEMEAYCNTFVNHKGKKVKGKSRFFAYDVNNDNIVTVSEIEAGINWIENKKRVQRLKNKGAKPVNNNSYDGGGIDDSVLTLEESLNAIPEEDDHVDLDEDISLDDFKSKFFSEKTKPSKKKNKKKVQNIDHNEQFKKLDSDGDGSVNMSELKTFNNNKDNTKILFIGYDQNQDQKITLDEFSKGINWKLVRKYKNSLK